MSKVDIEKKNLPGFDRPIKFVYQNWQGETKTRRAIPIRVFFGTTSYHPEPQFIMEALCLDRDEIRCFALGSIFGIQQL